MSEITQFLEAVERGENSAERLSPPVYAELRRLAADKLASEVSGQTLQPTALVHEAWLKLTGDENQQWNGLTYFSPQRQKRCAVS